MLIRQFFPSLSQVGVLLYARYGNHNETHTLLTTPP